MAARNIPQNEPAARTPGNALPVWGNALISALIAAHIAAITSTPFAFACNRGASPIAEAFRSFFLPYTSALYLAHGYAFFAPDPGPNHLVDYTLEYSDGRAAKSGRFPDLKTERPRLLYHRYFMLSEALHNRFTLPQFDREPTPPALTATAGERERFAVIKKDYEGAKERWQQARRQYEAMRGSIENHLKHAYGAEHVKITRVEHRPADPDEVLYERRALNAAESYRELSETPPMR